MICFADILPEKVAPLILWLELYVTSQSSANIYNIYKNVVIKNLILSTRNCNFENM